MYNDHQPLEDFFGIKSESSPDNKQGTNGEPRPGREPLHKSIKKNGLTIIESIRLLPKVLSSRERLIIAACVVLIIGAVISIPFSIFHHFTKAAPAFGGSFTEGIIGQPRHINPLLSQTNDADRDLTSLIYSSLLKYDEKGNLIPDLAKSYEISSDGLNYTVYLKADAKWSDGEAVTADDVVFTIQSAQNSDYGSTQRINWQGVQVQKVDNTTIIFKLKSKYAQFLNNFTIGILPAHIWGKIQPINFSVSDYNLKPVGSGPYVFKKLTKDDLGRIQSYELVSNENYYEGQPYISGISIRFYDSEEASINAYNNNEVQSLSSISPQNISKLKFTQRVTIHEIGIPRYFGVFFNQNQSTVLANQNVRLALSYATDTKAIIDSILKGKAKSVSSPIVDNIIGIPSASTVYSYDIDHAKKVLEADGWKADAGGALKKKDLGLSVRITTPVFPELVSVAGMLKEQWAKIGVTVTIDTLPSAQLQQVIKERTYEALLFGEILNPDPDPFSLWHSSQIRDPGLNLALYNNKSADSILEDARQSLNPTDRAKKYDDFQKLLMTDAPALFLYNPLYLYPQTKNIQGFETTLISTPSNRFDNIEHWYINTERVGR